MMHIIHLLDCMERIHQSSFYNKPKSNYENVKRKMLRYNYQKINVSSRI